MQRVTRLGPIRDHAVLRTAVCLEMGVCRFETPCNYVGPIVKLFDRVRHLMVTRNVKTKRHKTQVVEFFWLGF